MKFHGALIGRVSISCLIFPMRVFPARLIALILMTTGLVTPSLSEEQRELPNALFAQPASAWFEPAQCRQPNNQKMHFLVGRNVLAVPVANVRAMYPSQIASMTRGSDGQIMARISRNAACPEAPLPAAMINLSGLSTANDPGIAISETPDNGAAFEAQLAKHRDSGECGSPESGLVTCKGNRSSPSGRQQVAYLIAADTSLRQFSGGPLKAFCILKEGRKCSVIDDLEGGIRFQIAIGSSPSIADIRKSDEMGRSVVERFRVH